MNRPRDQSALATCERNANKGVTSSGLSVHDMSSESKWRETTVSACKGPSGHGRNLGTSARWSDGLPCQEDPHGCTRCREEYSGRRAGAPGTDHVCQGKRGTT